MTRELETHEIQTLLSRPAGPAALSRRAFLIGALASAGTLAVAPYASAASRLVGASSVAADGGVLVLVQLAGGMDGLNVVVPLGDSAYAPTRGANAISASVAHVLDPGGTVGLHPALTGLAARYAAGQVAIVRGVDYPNPGLSHFSSMADWMSGLPGSVPTTGWLGRWLDQVGNPDGLTGVAIGDSVPLHLVGATTEATSLPVNQSNAWGAANLANGFNVSLYQATDALAATSTGLGPVGDALAQTMARSTDQAAGLSPLYTPALPDQSLASQMILAARVINAQIGVKVIHVALGSFDTHSGEAWMLNSLLTQLDGAITAFYGALDPSQSSRVAIATWSEFGRRVSFNGSAGTDHGTANSMFVIGANVAGGLITPQPSMAHVALDAYGNLVPTTDFRQVYATLIDSWLGGDAAEVLPGATSTQLAALPLFAAPPSGSAGSPPPFGGFPTPPSSPPRGSPGGGNGYWLVTAAGQVLNFSRPVAAMSVGPGAPVVAMAASPSSRGWWLVRSDGTVLSGGDAGFHGDLRKAHLDQPIVSMASSPSGSGYWLMGADGGIFAFGDAAFHGSTGGLHLNRPAVTLAATPTGAGYWFAAADGGIFAFGDAGFYGSTGSIRLNQPIVGMCPTASGRGYWLVAADGGIFAFGDAGFHGSTGSMRLNKPIVGMAATVSGNGYWLVASDGGIFAFGDAPFVGSAGAHPPSSPVLGIVT